VQASSLMLALLFLLPERLEQIQFQIVKERISVFACEELLKANCDASREHFRWLQRAAPIISDHRRESYYHQLAQAERSAKCWGYLEKAWCDVSMARFGSSSRDEWMRSAVRVYILLERELGEENLQAGRMPPPMPYWYFQRTD
jgi:hypothetical protein